MSGITDYHHRGTVIGAKIRSLLCSLGPSTYDKVSPKIEYWIEYALIEQSVSPEALAEQLSSVAWDHCNSGPVIVGFLREFYDAPHRSKQARSCVDRLCARILRWFAAASAEDIPFYTLPLVVGTDGSNSFRKAASFVGHIIGRGLLSNELVRRHLVKPLLAHHPTDRNNGGECVRANAIHQLFVAAGDTLLHGLLEPEDVQACFEMLDFHISIRAIVLLDAGKLQKLRESHAAWLKKEEERRDATGVQEPVGVEVGGTAAAEASAEAETPVVFIPQDLPATSDIPSSILHGIETSFVLRDVESPSAPFINTPTITVSSPTLSISTVSDLTPTELSEEETTGYRRHDTFYFEDGNVEITCGGTVFRVHSSIISFSSCTLRDLLSPSTLLDAPMPEGRPRIVFTDNPEDFVVLLKMIYTPGFPARRGVPEFIVFAPLIRMATKYGFPDVRGQLIDDIKDAYPVRWGDFEAAKVLGEDIFGSPKPHPNAVLNLFLGQRIEPALPFAAYRAGLGGPSTLVSDRLGTVLPPPTLASITHGMGVMRRMAVLAAQRIAYTGDLGVCPEKVCILGVGVDRTEQRVKALNEIFIVMVRGSEGDMLSPLSLGTLVCVNCMTRLEKVHLCFRKEFVWAGLPSLLGWNGWEGV